MLHFLQSLLFFFFSRSGLYTCKYAQTHGQTHAHLENNEHACMHAFLCSSQYHLLKKKQLIEAMLIKHRNGA